MSILSKKKYGNKRFGEYRVTLKKDIVIPAGTVLELGPEKVEYCSDHYEEIMAFGKDHTGYFTIDIDAIRANPELFEIGCFGTFGQEKKD